MRMVTILAHLGMPDHILEKKEQVLYPGIEHGLYGLISLVLQGKQSL